MKKLLYLVLSFLLIPFSFCLGTYAETYTEPTSVENPTNQPTSPFSDEENKKIDEFYSHWRKEQLKLDDENFVNYYALIRENYEGKKSDSLLIYLDGSGYDSVMGVKGAGGWETLGNPYGITKTYLPEYDFLTIEKMNVQMGSSHFGDSLVVNNYSFENRVSHCVSVIDTFLKDKSYKNVFIFGMSEGGQILPRVYEELKSKDKITKLVVLGAGGLSQYEEFKVLKDKDLPMPPGFKEGYSQVELAYKDIMENPTSVEKQYFGYTYKSWYGFMNYSPLTDYQKIEIPILLLHGAMDINSPVESARAVQSEFDKLDKTNLKYIEYENMDHGPVTKEESMEMFHTIAEFLK